MTRAMERAAFERLIDAEGPDLAAWPPGARAAAQALLAADPAARASLAAARALRRDFAALRGAPPPPLAPDFAARLAAQARTALEAAPAATCAPAGAARPGLRDDRRSARTARPVGRRARIGWTSPAAMAMAASVALGLWLGGTGVVDPFASANAGLDDVDLFGGASAELFAEAS